MIICKFGDTFPKSCDTCPLFVTGIVGHTSYCILDGEYTDEEVEAEEDGELQMYYDGCLKNRPKNCPLIEVPDSELKIDA